MASRTTYEQRRFERKALRLKACIRIALQRGFRPRINRGSAGTPPRSRTPIYSPLTVLALSRLIDCCLALRSVHWVCRPGLRQRLPLGQ